MLEGYITPSVVAHHRGLLLTRQDRVGEEVGRENQARAKEGETLDAMAVREHLSNHAHVLPIELERADRHRTDGNHSRRAYLAREPVAHLLLVREHD